MAMRADSFNYLLYVRESGRTLRVKSADDGVRRAIALARRSTKRRQILNVVPSFDEGGTVREKRLTDSITIGSSDISQFCNVLAACEARLAAVIVTPDEKNPKNRGFLREVRELTSAEGAWLIWKQEENLGGESHGPQEILGIRPDITCFREKRHVAP